MKNKNSIPLATHRLAIKDPTQFQCPACLVQLGGATSVGHEQAPKEGNVSVCAYCITILEYKNKDGRLTLVEFPKEDLEEMEREEPESFALLMETAQFFKDRIK